MAETLFTMSAVGIAITVIVAMLAMIAWLIKESIASARSRDFALAILMGGLAWVIFLIMVMVIALAMTPKTG